MQANRKLRRGYTTGSCAAAAAKAAAKALLSKMTVMDNIEITLPNGGTLTLPVSECEAASDSAKYSVIKDSGDDPDITNGICVCADVSLIGCGVEIYGGDGVGIVTKKGLDQPVGAAAINSVPRKMIEQSVMQIAHEYGYSGGFRVTVSVPGGAELAKKTYNPHMGITGGISIIGTTGIVEPMSNAALIDTIRLEERMRRAEGCENLLLTPGNYGEKFIAGKMPFALEKSVKCSNYIGEAVDAALEYGFSGILIIGHIGKLVKLGAGIMNTHSAQADGRMDVLVTCGVIADVENAVLRKLPDCATVDAAVEILSEAGAVSRVMEVLSEKAQHYLDAKVKNAVKIAAVMFSDKYGVLVKNSAAEEMIERISEEYGK